MNNQEEVRKILAANVAKIRTAKEWTQKHLASKAGLSKHLISHVETKKANISIDNLTAIANVLDVKPHQLLTPCFHELWH